MPIPEGIKLWSKTANTNDSELAAESGSELRKIWFQPVMITAASLNNQPRRSLHSNRFQLVCRVHALLLFPTLLRYMAFMRSVCASTATPIPGSSVWKFSITSTWRRWLTTRFCACTGGCRRRYEQLTRYIVVIFLLLILVFDCLLSVWLCVFFFVHFVC